MPSVWSTVIPPCYQELNWDLSSLIAVQGLLMLIIPFTTFLSFPREAFEGIDFR
jgi:hypothetical protein